MAAPGRKLRESAWFDEIVAESAASDAKADGFLRMKLDRFDKSILQALQLDGRVSNAALAERLSQLRLARTEHLRHGAEPSLDLGLRLQHCGHAFFGVARPCQLQHGPAYCLVHERRVKAGGIDSKDRLKGGTSSYNLTP